MDHIAGTLVYGVKSQSGHVGLGMPITLCALPATHAGREVQPMIRCLHTCRFVQGTTLAMPFWSL